MKTILLEIDGKISNNITITPTTTISSLINKASQYINSTSEFSYKIGLNIKPTGPHVPEYVFSDPSYLNSTLESIYDQMENSILILAKTNYKIWEPEFNVEYKIIPRSEISQDDINSYMYNTISDVNNIYRWLFLPYFDPIIDDDMEYFIENINKQNIAESSITMKARLYRNNNNHILYKEPPSYMKEISDYSTWNEIIVSDAILIKK